jgi:cobalt transporter subunit CbtB
VQNQNIQQVQVARSETMIAAILGLLVGTFLIIGVGFAHSDAIHNAAHDTRHTTGFPCH